MGFFSAVDSNFKITFGSSGQHGGEPVIIGHMQVESSICFIMYDIPIVLPSPSWFLSFTH